MAGENHANQRPGEVSEGRASRAKRNEPEVTGAWSVCGTAVEAEMAGEARGQCMGSSADHGALDFILSMMGRHFGFTYIFKSSLLGIVMRMD